MKKTVIAIASTLLLSACAMSDPSPRQPEFDFSAVPRIPLNVAKIEVQDTYVAPTRAPNVEHTFHTTPAEAAHRLVQDVLTPGNGGKTLRVVIEDASVVDKKLPPANDLLGPLSRAPSDRYDAKVSIRFELVDPAAPDIIAAHAEVVAKRSRTFMNNDTPADRDAGAYELTKALMDDVVDGLQTVVKRSFGQP